VRHPPPLDRSTIEAAAARLRGHVHHTPLLTSTTLNHEVGAEVFVKCENFQRTGAFKFRGAFNAIARLPVQQRSRGVVTFSSGNHGQAVSLAAKEFGVRATIVMPEDAPASKMAAVIHYGGEIVTYDRYTDDRVMIAEQLALNAAMTLIPPYEHPDVIAGQGTVGLELLAEVGSLDAVLAPLGGGGLIAGMATFVTAAAPGIKVLGVEPLASSDHAQSIAADRRVQVPVPGTIADGLAVAIPGELTFEINRRLLEEVAVVTDQEIVAAMRFLFDRMKLVVEPSGAAAIAALLSGRLSLTGSRVGVVISGGNVDTQRFTELLNSSSA
jgi:threo-3-hydroxy-L-aspartate ammonia-lyase